MTPYLTLVKDVLTNGTKREDRTGTGTISLFGTQTRYDLRDGFPILTTKKIIFDSVVKELLWFLRGETNIKTLECGIWDEWAEPDGSLGPIYGAQWRRWTYRLGPQVDQIAELAANLVNNPSSRRHIVSAWNVAHIHNMALPPCHTMFQCYVSDGHLDLQLYQRSCDLGLGAGFNIASYSLLMEMLALATGYRARYFIHTIGDAHVYLNHVEALTKQLQREPYPLPRLVIKRAPDFSSPAAMTMTPDDFELVGHKHHPFIRLPVAV